MNSKLGSYGNLGGLASVTSYRAIKKFSIDQNEAITDGTIATLRNGNYLHVFTLKGIHKIAKLDWKSSKKWVESSVAK